MSRSVNSPASRARRKKFLGMAKGYVMGNSRLYTVARNRVEKGLQYAYRDRKAKKREYRALWIQRINAGVRELGYSYSAFMGRLNKSEVSLDRKVLADLAMNNPESFKAVVEQIMK
ncbi:MAG: 50S ribosomal protein L20 [Cytophagales bacterium]|nr:50S ribosomal protein L20 [Cytophagales bacterium]